MYTPSSLFHLAKEVQQPITENEAEVEKQLLKEFECPVCLTYATPAIFMCLNSHVICGDCWEKCEICPTCRAPRSITRATFLEKIHPLLSFPCKFEGCPFRANGSFTQEHEVNCNYFPIKCPLSKVQTCTWSGPMGHARPHLIENHRSNVFFDPGVRLVSGGFRFCKNKSYTLIFYCYERLFRFSWEFDSLKSSVAAFSMVQIGKRNNNESFQYTVAFSRHFPIRAGNKRAFVMDSSVSKDYTEEYQPQQDEQPPKVSQWGISFNHLVTFCTKPNGDLYYEVIIRRHYGLPREHEILTLQEYESLVED